MGYYFLQKIIAAITPGIQPTQVKTKVINTEPQPLSRTASGGHKIQTKARKKLILISLHKFKFHT